MRNAPGRHHDLTLTNSIVANRPPIASTRTDGPAVDLLDARDHRFHRIPSAIIFGLFIEETRNLSLEAASREEP